MTLRTSAHDMHALAANVHKAGVQILEKTRNLVPQTNQITRLLADKADTLKLFKMYEVMDFIRKIDFQGSFIQHLSDPEKRASLEKALGKANLKKLEDLEKNWHAVAKDVDDLREALKKLQAVLPRSSSGAGQQYLYEIRAITSAADKVGGHPESHRNEFMDLVGALASAKNKIEKVPDELLS